MLGIVDDALAVGFEIRDGLLDDAQVVFVGGLQNFLDVKRPCLAKDGADGRVANRARP